MNLMVQGRTVSVADLEQIRQLITQNPEWSRRKLSQALCEQWDWRNGAGQWKDMASRTLLVKLDSRGLIQLPERRQTPSNRMRPRPLPVCQTEEPRIQCSLAQLGPLTVREVSQDPAQRGQLMTALRAHHYLGYAGAVGQNLQYVVCDTWSSDRPHGSARLAMSSSAGRLSNAAVNSLASSTTADSSSCPRWLCRIWPAGSWGLSRGACRGTGR